MQHLSNFYEHRSKFRGCLICVEKEPFASRRALVDHYREKHSWFEKKRCDNCNPEKFFQDDASLRHFQSHFPEREFSCKMCGFSSNRLRTIKDHIQKVHSFTVDEELSKQELRQYIPLPEDIDYKRCLKKNYCMICTDIEVAEEDFESHVSAKHHGIYQCHVCDKQFKDMSIFKKHLEIHNALAKYQCNFCKMRFPDEYTTRGHLKLKHFDEMQSMDLDALIVDIPPLF